MDDATGPPWWKRYWLVGALIAPLLIMGAWELLTGGGKGVPVVGAGALSVLRAEDAPEGARYQLRLRAHEEVAGTRARIEEAVTEWPDVLVFGFDGSALGSEADEEAMRAAYGALAAQVENAAGVPVIVGPTATTGAPERPAVERVAGWLRDGLCVQGRYRVCVDLAPHGADPRALREAVAAGVRDGFARHDALQASTQVGR